MTTDPTDRETVERWAQLLEKDADAQNFTPCEMTGLLPGDEYEIAVGLRALLARAEAAEAERDALWKAINQCRLAFSGYVDARTAVDMIDALDQPKEGKDDE